MINFTFFLGLVRSAWPFLINHLNPNSELMEFFGKRRLRLFIFMVAVFMCLATLALKEEVGRLIQTNEMLQQQLDEQQTVQKEDD